MPAAEQTPPVLRQIESASNPIIKLARGLNKVSAHRKSTGLCVVEGVWAVKGAVETRAEVTHLLGTPALLADPEVVALVRQLQRRGADCIQVPPSLYATLSRQENPPGLAAVVRQRWEALSSLRLEAGQCWVALDSVKDPGNVGTIIRTGSAVGAAGLLLLGDSTDPYHPIAARATAGALFRQRYARSSFATFAEWKRQHGWPVVGTSPRATADYRQLRYPDPVILLLGSERAGLSARQQAVCDEVVRIPMVGTAESLNLAVAAAVVLYEVFSQRRGASSA